MKRALRRRTGPLYRARPQIGNRKTDAVKNPPLQEVYEALHAHFGPQHWWPGRTRWEVIVGAILTQNTSWANVERCLRRLRKEGALALPALRRMTRPALAARLRPVGYFNIKARRLKAFVDMMYNRFDGRVRRLFALDTPRLREVLLEVNGVGPETADSIVLYAGKRPVFVVDAYTRRFLVRHGWLRPAAGYDEVAEFFTTRLPRDEKLFNEYHALIVALGKYLCRPKPRCEACPLRRWLPPGGPLGG
jgi:endonuclease-3 related protein